MSAPAPKVVQNHVSAVALAPAPAFPSLSAAALVVEDLSVVPPDAALAAPVPAALQPPRTIIVTRATRAEERSVLPGCDGTVPDRNTVNGRLPERDLCTLWDGKHQLRADAAVAFAKLDIAYRQRFGDDISVTDGYRVIAEQRRLKAVKPGLAATPGTSEHGWGLAGDLCDGIQTGAGSRWSWVRANAPRYGWDNPDWARHGGRGPYEPWHWEFLPGEG